MEAAGELEIGSVEDNLVEAQAECYLQMIEDNMQERIEVVLPGLSEDERRVNKLRLVQSLYKEGSSSPSW
jgi:DNA-directed RNA polymerase sigma subunit (sigma70/sigma32)